MQLSVGGGVQEAMSVGSTEALPVGYSLVAEVEGEESV